MARSSSRKTTIRKIGEEVERLEALFASIPTFLLRRRLQRNLKAEVSHLVSSVDDGYWSLRKRAQLGDLDALKFLHEVGCSISELFEELAHGVDSKIQMPAINENIRNIDIRAADGSIAESLKNLQAFRSDDLHVVLQSLEKQFGGRAALGSVRGIVEVKAGFEANAEVESEEANQREWAIDGIVELLVEVRIKRRVSQIVRDFAAGSYRWPVCIDPTIESRRHLVERVLDESTLGQKLPFGFGAKKGRRETKRNTATSVRKFALDAMEVLEKMKQQLSSVEQEDDSIASMVAELPEFPTGPGEDLDRWYKAGIVILEIQCGGDFDNHVWPPCVYPKKKNLTRKRTTRELVLKALKRGLLNLVASPNGVPQDTRD